MTAVTALMPAIAAATALPYRRVPVLNAIGGVVAMPVGLRRHRRRAQPVGSGSRM
jgi:hypothetical protein